MKRFKKYTLLALAGTFVLTACSRVEDLIFEQSPAERIEAALVEAQKALTAPANGWVMQIYPSATQKWGGYTVLVKFNVDGTVVAASELFDADKTFTSNYRIDDSNLPTLNFDTYNEAIHLFSLPNLNAIIARERNAGNTKLDSFNGASSNQGLEGDNSYQIVSASPVSVKLRGMRSQSNIVLRPATAEEWKTQIEAIQKASDTYVIPRVKLNVNGKEYSGRMSRGTRQLRLLDSNDEVVLQTAFSYTANGLELYQPATIDGVTFQSFVSAGGETIQLRSAEGNAVLEPRIFAISELIADTKELWNIYTQGVVNAESSGRFRNAFDTYERLMGEKYMLFSVDFGASEFEGYTGFGIYIAAMSLETYNFSTAFLPIDVTVDSPTELTMKFAPNRLSEEERNAMNQGLFAILVAGFSGVGQIKAEDGSFIYNEELAPRSFTVTTNSLVNTEWIRLEDKDDPDNWIQLNRAVVVDP